MISNKTVKNKYYRILGNLDPRTRTWVQFVRHHHYLPNFRDPKTFNELVQARKLYGKKSIYAQLSDKLLVKSYVASILGDSFVIPTLWAGTELPEATERNWRAPFVLKANHGAGLNHFIRAKEDINWERIEKKIGRWLKTDWAKHLCEEWYNEIDRKVLIEPIIGCGKEELSDYKLYVFGGVVRYIQFDRNRFSDHTRAFYSRDWVKQNFSKGGVPIDKEDSSKPVFYDDIIAAAEKLGQDFDFVRIDFYDLPDHPKFGEMTFSPGSGFSPFSSKSVDRMFGQIWREVLDKAR